jgi:hypothetical protein
MSNLLSQASLVMIPSGYKEDIVYSQIPTSGAGDLSFTRASNGTRINSAGLVEVCPWNLCTYSEELNIWTTERAAVTTNATTAPNGTTTADKVITDSTANNTHQIYIGPFTTQNLPMVISCYAKKSEYNYIHLGAGGATTKTWFNLNDGTVGTQSSDVLSASIENVGNGWYRCINVINNTSTSNYVEFGPASVDGSRVISGTPSGGIFAWGAQLNIGSTAKPYFPTTDRLNVPRLTYQNGGGGCPSLLLEKQSTNVLTYSEQFDNGAWIKASATVSANSAISPDGTQNADLIYPTSSASNLGAYQFNAGVIGVVGTVSCYVKSAGKNWALLGTDNTSPYNVSFDLFNGVVGSVPSGYTATITSVGNGWFRITATFQSGSSLAYPFIGVADNTNRSVTADGTNGIYIWGFQAELSSYPTSYIPTTSASATRVADACYKTGISSLIGQTEGVLFVDFELKAYDSLAKWIAFLGSGSYYIGLYTDGNSRFVAEVYDGAIQFVNQTFTFSVGQRYKIAIAYKANDFAFYINGTQIATDSSGTVPTTSAFSFEYNSTAAQLTTRIYNQSALFKTRLTNAELASLTTI